MQDAPEVARRLLEIRAVQLSPSAPFTWASGILSPIYCDNRVVLSHPEVRRFIKHCFVEASRAFEGFEAVAGVATAGIAHGMLLADALDLPFAYVRADAKGHGRRNQIEGALQEGALVLVVEDLISTGGSSLAAVDALREAGFTVVGVLAIFQYGFERARSAFADRQVSFFTLTDYDTLLDQAIATGYIGDDDLRTLRQWRENPEGWGALYANH